jgi:ribosomal RNA-processing protein 8
LLDKQKFVEVLSKIGFRCTHKDNSNTMFVMFDFVREEAMASEEERNEAIAAFSLTPCIYKRR